MAPTTLEIDSNYGYVLGSAIVTSALTIFHVLHTAGYRKKAGIKYPHAYATAEQMSSDKAAYLFQCAQRSHVTYLEHQPLVLTTLLISGLKFPLLASGSALIWCAGRIIYARGYVDPAKEQGKGRLRGTFGYLGELSLLALSALTAGMVVMGY